MESRSGTPGMTMLRLCTRMTLQEHFPNLLIVGTMSMEVWVYVAPRYNPSKCKAKSLWAESRARRGIRLRELEYQAFLLLSFQSAMNIGAAIGGSDGGLGEVSVIERQGGIIPSLTVKVYMKWPWTYIYSINWRWSSFCCVDFLLITNFELAQK